MLLCLWKFLSNSQATFNLENVNLLCNPNINTKMELGDICFVYQDFSSGISIMSFFTSV